MPRVPTITFNGGELSPSLDVRGDLDKYAAGCREMLNMLPLIQGAATRRPGTQFIAYAKNGSDSVRLIPFIYSSTVAYIVELGQQYARFFYNGAALLDANSVVVEITTPYQSADLKALQFKQVGDVMWLVHPSYPPAKLKRTTATSFTLENIVFTGGPFMKRNDIANDNDVTLTCSVASEGETGTLTASSATFLPQHIGSYWQLIETRRDMSVAEKLTSVRTGAAINVDGTFTFETTGTWVGTVLLERNVDSQGWDVYRTYVHDAGTDSNVSYSGTEADANVKYRVRVSAYTSGTIYTTISANFSQVKGIVRIDAVNSTTVANVTVIEPLVYATSKLITKITKAAACVITSAKHGLSDGDAITISDVGGMTQLNGNSYTVGEVTKNTFRLRNAADSAYVDSSGYTTYTTGGYVNAFAGTLNTLTSRWAEGAWSAVRGYPSALAFFENRIVFAGTTGQPQTVWFSATDDYENFAEGVDDDDSFSLTMAATNRIRWMEAIDALAVGTAADEWRITSNKLGYPLTPTNFNIRQQTTYGSDRVQPIKANRVVLFLDFAGRKVREFTYRGEGDEYAAPDMTALADHVTEGGIVGMALQKNPDMILWCFRGDGTLLSLTYDRTQNVTAWARHTMGDTHAVTGAGGGGEGGTDQPEPPAAPAVTPPAEIDYGEDDPVPSACALDFGAEWDALNTTPFTPTEGYYYQYQIKDYADGMFDVSGEATLADDSGSNYWDGLYSGLASGTQCLWNAEVVNGTRSDSKKIGFGATPGGANDGISLGSGYWQIVVPFVLSDDSTWNSGWTGRKTTGSTPVGRYTRTAGLATSPVYIDIEAVL